MAAQRKPITTIEKIFLTYNQLRGPFASNIVVEGQGRIDPQALQAALDLTTAANPGSRLRAAGHLGWRAWVPGPPPRLRVVKDAGWDGRTEASDTWFEGPLPPSGPTCEVVLVEGEARTFVIFRSLHAVMDGVGAIFWIQDVFRALRGEAPLGHPSMLCDTDFAAGITDDKMVLPPRDALHPCGRADGPSPGTGKDFCWRRVTVDDMGDAPLVPALAVALATEARRHRPGTVRFNVPVDLRPFRKDERSTGNAIGALFVEVPPGAGVAEVAADLKQRLRAREHARFPGFYQRMRWLPMGLLAGMMARGFAHEHESGLYPFTATLTILNLGGPVAMSAPGFTPTTTFGIPPLADQPCYAGFVSFGSRHELIVAMPRVLASRGRLDALVDRLVSAVRRS